LMMVATTFEHGLTITMEGETVSTPYINLTASLMNECGGQVKLDENKIIISPCDFKNVIMPVESDWSAAAFWFGISVLSHKKLLLKGLLSPSVQGDSWVKEWFE